MEQVAIIAASAERIAFGLAVRELRGRRGISRAQLGRAVRVHEAYLGAIERAEVEPTLRTMAKIAAGLGLPLSVVVRRYEERLAAGGRCCGAGGGGHTGGGAGGGGHGDGGAGSQAGRRGGYVDEGGA